MFFSQIQTMYCHSCVWCWIYSKEEGSIWGCPNTPSFYLSIFIYVCSTIFSIHFQVMRYHRHICLSLPPLCLHLALLVLVLFSLPPLSLPSPIIPSIFIQTAPPCLPHHSLLLSSSCLLSVPSPPSRSRSPCSDELPSPPGELDR